MQKIKELWEEHEKSKFPANLRGKSLVGVDLTGIHSEIGGYIISFILNGGQLGQRRLELLKKCSESLDTVIGNLDPDARPYFEELKEITKLVIASAKHC